MERIYIRFGEIPENERSEIHNRGVEEHEIGVSVWDAVLLDDGYHLVAPRNGNCSTYADFIANAFPEEFYPKPLPDIKIYVVAGDNVGRGADNEPLLRNVKIIDELPFDYFGYGKIEKFVMQCTSFCR